MYVRLIPSSNHGGVCRAGETSERLPLLQDGMVTGKDCSSRYLAAVVGIKSNVAPEPLQQ